MIQSMAALRTKFIARVTNMGDRIMIIFPKEQEKDAKQFKGKYVKVTVEEVTLDDE
jgi:hypothetical protein